MKPAWTWTRLDVDLLGLGAPSGLGACLSLGGLLRLGSPFGLGSPLDLVPLWTWVPFGLTYLSKDSKVEIT